MKTKIRKNADRILLFTVPVLTFLFLCGIVYIPFMNQIGYFYDSTVIRTYVESCMGQREDRKNSTPSQSESSLLPDNDIHTELLRARRYNREIESRQICEPFYYRGSINEPQEYHSLLAGPGGVMCILEIPSINVYLPVGHGTSDEVLEKMAGHVCGTSLPVGGRSANAVIAAHSGRPSSRLFTDLGQMTSGDKIYVHVGNEILTYMVCSDSDIYVVLPYDGLPEHAASYGYDAPYFQIVPGEDILTLYTCTPVGINSHRLIVQARRIETDTDKAPSYMDFSETKGVKSLLAACLYALVPLLGSALMYMQVRRSGDSDIKRLPH